MYFGPMSIGADSGPLGLYFDAAVVFTFIQIGSDAVAFYLWYF